MWGKAHCQHVEENNCSLTQTLSDVTFIMQTGPAVSKDKEQGKKNPYIYAQGQKNKEKRESPAGKDETPFV